MTSTPTELLRDKVISQLQRVIDSSPATVIFLVPSVRDMISRHVAYPQAMLDRESLGIPKVSLLLVRALKLTISESNCYQIHAHSPSMKSLSHPPPSTSSSTCVAKSSSPKRKRRNRPASRR